MMHDVAGGGIGFDIKALAINSRPSKNKGVFEGAESVGKMPTRQLARRWRYLKNWPF
jgi:hypothetical protein